MRLRSSGAALEALSKIDISGIDKRLAACRIEVACDVTNPLTGKEGHLRYLVQKGATPEMIQRLDDALTHYARLISRDLDINVFELAGGGAAGGLCRIICVLRRGVTARH